MRRGGTAQILDTDECSPADLQASLRDLGLINRWFGGVSTTQSMTERVARVTGKQHFSLLDVASGSGEVPLRVAEKLSRRGITLDITLLDRAPSHLSRDRRSLVGDGLALPFRDGAFDLVSCNLFAHHLGPEDLGGFVKEALRVSRCAMLINDLVRHPLHLALVYAGFPLMRSRISRLDGVASVRRAYVPDEIRQIVSSAFRGEAPPVEISGHYLFRMGVIVWKRPANGSNAQGKQVA